MNETDTLISHILHLASLEPPKSVKHQVERCLIDYISCLYAGSKSSLYAGSLVMSDDVYCYGISRIFGTGEKSTPERAALLNAISSHTVELDDGHRRAMMHLGSPIFSALLAAWDSEEMGDFRRFTLGAICGYQAAIILASSLQPAHKVRGFHCTGTCGSIGAAVGVSIMLGYDADQLKSAIALAATSASGLLEMIDGESQMKPFNAGHAAMSGYIAASLGRKRPIAPQDPIGGKRGFLEVLAGGEGHRGLCVGDDPYLIMGIYQKPYAACRHCHPAIEAAECLVKQYDLKPADISRINARTYDLAVYGHDSDSNFTVSSAKMSTPYCVASVICGNGASLSSFNDSAVAREDISKLARKIDVIADGEMTAQLPEKRGCVLEVVLLNGTVYSYRVDYPKGEPENPMTDDELVTKLKTLVTASSFCSKNDTDAFISDFRSGRMECLISRLR